MQIVHYNNVDFNTDKDGNITRRSIWHVMADEDVIDTWLDLREAVDEWAGAIGDDWRLPGKDSRSYTTDENYVVTDIDFKSLSRFMYEVSYTGEPKYITAEMIGGIDISINDNAETEKSASWRVHADTLDDWLPSISDVITWAGQLFMCSDIKATGSASGVYEVSITAKDMSLLMLGNPSYQKNRMREQVRNATWRVSNAAIDDFLNTYDIDCDASAWAGEGYYITDINSEPLGKLGYNVTLEAKHISVRQISAKKDVQFKGYSNSGTRKTSTWTGTWQVHKDSLDEFYAMIGESATDWAEEGFIITDVHPTFISGIEYEVTLTAKDLIEGAADTSNSHDYRDDIESGIPVYTGDTTEFVVTPDMAGWTWSDKTQQFVSIPKWEGETECPFTGYGKTKTLTKNIINASFKCATITKTIYMEGEPARFVGYLNRWQHTTTQVASSKIGDHSGSFRKINISSKRVMNRAGETFTRIDEVYQSAPGDFTWNKAWVDKGIG